MELSSNGIQRNHHQMEGCHTILFGVETASEKSLKSMGKGYTLRQVEETFRLCREYGVRTLATYILGLPGEDREDIVKTVEFAVRVGSGFVSFNTLYRGRGHRDGSM